jgi:two-component system OmpR family response regulator
MGGIAGARGRDTTRVVRRALACMVTDAARGVDAQCVARPTIDPKRASNADNVGDTRIMAQRVLLIDDDARLFELLSAYLAQNGFVVVGARDGLRGLSLLDSDTFDAVLLDVMMPGLDGIEVCKRIRARSRVPVVMLTAKGDETDRVVGLELGADDYVTKPFSPRELLARLRAVLRRTQPADDEGTLRVGPLALDVAGRSVTLEGRVVELTGIEFDLLLGLARRAGRVVPRESMLSAAGRDDVSVSERTVDVHVSHLRQKLGDDPRAPRLIKTVRGIGYVLAKDGA